MQIEKESSGSSLTVKVKGQLNAATAPELQAELNDCLSEIDDLTLDLAELKYISSAGLRVLLNVYKIMSVHGSMKLVHVESGVHEVLKLTGFSDFLTIE